MQSHLRFWELALQHMSLGRGHSSGLKFSLAVDCRYQILVLRACLWAACNQVNSFLHRQQDKNWESKQNRSQSLLAVKTWGVTPCQFHHILFIRSGVWSQLFVMLYRICRNCHPMSLLWLLLTNSGTMENVRSDTLFHLDLGFLAFFKIWRRFF